MMAQKSFRDRGLVGRFLYSLPQSRLGHRDIAPPGVPAEIRDDYEDNVRTLLEFGRSKSEEPLMLCLASDAVRLLQDFSQQFELRLAEDGDLAHMDDWAGKLVGAVLRIAALLHVAEQAGAYAPIETPITAATVTSAITVGRYLIEHAQAAYAEFGADPEIESAKQVLRWIRREGAETFTKRDVHVAHRARFSKADLIDPVLTILEEHGFILKMNTEAKNKPGRNASPTYRVHPSLLPQNTHIPQNGHVPKAVLPNLAPQKTQIAQNGVQAGAA
jgi:hypothetical protein